MTLPQNRSFRRAGPLLLLTAITVAACGVPDTATTRITRTAAYDEALPRAEGAPASFEVDTSQPDSRPQGLGECATRLRDASSDVRLHVLESTATRSIDGDTITVVVYGDYAVRPEGAYGVSGDARLRVDCARNAPVGVVAR